MSDGFITSAVVFTIVMVIFHILKDILLQGRKITADTRARINKRWLISLVVGLGFLFLLYGCVKEKTCTVGNITTINETRIDSTYVQREYLIELECYD